MLIVKPAGKGVIYRGFDVAQKPSGKFEITEGEAMSWVDAEKKRQSLVKGGK